MIEIVSPKEDRADLEKTLKKYHYKVYNLEGNLVFELRKYKPTTWFIYLILFVGVVRMFQQKFIQASISFALVVISLIVIYIEKKKFALTLNEIEKVAVAEEGVAISYSGQEGEPVQISKEDIKSFDVNLNIGRENTLGYITLKDINDNIHTLFIIMDKSSDVVRKVADDIVNSMKRTLGID